MLLNGMQTKLCYLRIYPFPSTRHSRGSTFTDLWLVFDSSRKKKSSFCRTVALAVLSHTLGTLRTSNTLFCPEMSNGHEPGVLLCQDSWKRTAPRERASTLQATSRFPKPWHGTGIRSCWRTWLRLLHREHRSKALDGTQGMSPHLIYMSQQWKPMWVLDHPS